MAVSGRKLSNISDSVLKSSAEDFDHKCDPCLTDDQHVEAHGFCVDCKEYLCKNCFKFHQRTRALKHHELLDKDNMAKGGASTAVSTSEVFTERCTTHKNEVIKFFCPIHESLGCNDCMTMDHRTCKIDYIPDKCAGIGDSVEYRDILKKLDHTLKAADYVMKKAEVRDKEIDTQYESVIKTIANFRKEINDRLDQLQKKISKVANKRRSQDKQTVKETLDTCANISSEFQTFQSSLQDNRTSNQNGQLYITIKQAKTKLKADAIGLLEHSLDEVNVQYTFEQDKQLEKIISEQHIFGELRFTANASRKVDQSKCLVHIDDITVRTDSDKGFFKCNVVGCAALSSNKIALIDGAQNRKVKVVDTERKCVVDEKILDLPPSGITALPNDLVAVTVTDSREIWILTASHNISFVRKIRLKEHCQYVTFCQDRLYVLCKEPHCILTVNMQGKVLDKLPLKNEFLVDTTCIACSENAAIIYISDCRTNKIIGVTLKGEVVAMYQDKSMRGPRGLEVLDDGSVLVCANANHTIHRITGDLKEGQNLDINATHTCTYSICYNRQQKRIYTGSFSSNTLKVFSLK